MKLIKGFLSGSLVLGLMSGSSYLSWQAADATYEVRQKIEKVQAAESRIDVVKSFLF